MIQLIEMLRNLAEEHGFSVKYVLFTPPAYQLFNNEINEIYNDPPDAQITVFRGIPVTMLGNSPILERCDGLMFIKRFDNITYGYFFHDDIGVQRDSYLRFLQNCIR